MLFQVAEFAIWASRRSGKISFAELATALEGVTCSSSREEVALLQQHARPPSSRTDSKLAENEGLVTVQDSKAFSGVHDGWTESHCEQIGPDEGPEGFHQCGCYHDDANTVRPNDNPTIYKSFTMWKPAPSTTVLTKVQQQHLLRDAAMRGMIPGVAYNPAILPLHQGLGRLAASWHPDAHYLVVARHFLLGQPNQCMPKTESAEFAWTGSDYSSIVLLNKNLKTLVVGKLPLPVEDYRLFAYQGKVLVTANAVDRSIKDKDQQWSYRVFELGLNMTRDRHNALQQCPRLLKVELTEFEHNGMSHFDHKNSEFRFYGKNIGLLNNNNNNKDGELQLLWRLSNPVAVRQWTSEILYTDRSSNALRNNGHPVYLPEYDAYLAFGHTHWEGSVIQHEKHNPLRVMRYIHRIVLFDAKPPYHWIRASEPLCLPAISRMSTGLDPTVREEWCEGVQFIMSWFREGDDILITYGILDCEPAVARLPLAVLRARLREGPKVTDRAQNADFGRKLQIFADSPLLLEVQTFQGRRTPQKTANVRRKVEDFRRKPAGKRRLGPQVHPVQGRVDFGQKLENRGFLGGFLLACFGRRTAQKHLRKKIHKSGEIEGQFLPEIVFAKGREFLLVCPWGWGLGSG